MNDVAALDAAILDATDWRAVTPMLLELDPEDVDAVERRWSAVVARLEQFDRVTGPQELQLDAGNRVLHAVRMVRLDRLRSAGIRSAGGGGGRYKLEAGAFGEPDPGNTSRGGFGGAALPAGVFGTAHRAIDEAARSGLLPDHAAQKATALVDRGPLRDRTTAAEWAARAGDPAYASAFAKVMGDPERGHLMWDDREREAFRSVQEFRAMSLVDSTGGYLVPAHLDPSILLTSDGSVSPLRQVARVVTVPGDSWNGVSSAGVTASWYAEAAEVGDNSPTLAQPVVPNHRGSAFVPFSFEVGMDGANFAAEMARLLVDAADQLQAAAFATGTGVGQPTGVITSLLGGSSVVAPTTAETFTAADVYKVQNALPPRFQPNARWAGNIAILNQLAQFETGNGARLFPEVGGNPPALLRHPLHELSGMDGAINAAVTADNPVLLYGDFSNYLICDRIGTTIELIPNLFGANRRPTGQRGFFMWFRTGGDSLVDNAFRLLNVATTA